MKKILLIALTCIAFTSCKRGLNDVETKVCGQWMLVDERGNRQWFTLKKDGTFTDDRFGNIDNMPISLKPETYSARDSTLSLKYRSFILFHSNINYKISGLTDSTMNIATRGSKKYPSRIYHLKKMKLNGKFIVV